MFPDISCDDIFRLETERLWLRWLRAGDATAVTAFAKLAEVAQMTASIPHPYPPGEAERFILTARASTAAGDALILAITLKKKPHSLIGLASVEATGPREAELGYVVAPPHGGRGYATEAATVLVDAVFNLTEAREIKATSRVGNVASRRVLEKCGFSATGSDLKYLPARGGKHPCDFFVLTRHRQRSKTHEASLPAMSHQPPRRDEQQTQAEAAQQQ